MKRPGVRCHLQACVVAKMMGVAFAVLSFGILIGPSWAQESSPAFHSAAETVKPVDIPENPERNTMRNWRDAFTPLEDPLLTRPPELTRDLQWKMPPELVEDKNAAVTRSPVDLVTESVSCANGASAADLNNPQHALRMLRDEQASDAPPVLSVSLAVQLAMCHNPQVRASWSMIAQQAAALGQARSAYLPTLGGGVGKQHGKITYPGSTIADQDIDRYSGNAGLRWRLFDFGSRSARTEAANYQLQAALQSQNATVQKALVTVLQTYFEAHSAQSRWQSQQNIMPLVERSLKSAQRRRAHGAGSNNDMLQAMSIKARAELELSKSRGDYETALSNLSFALGLPPGTVYQLAPLEFDAEMEATLKADEKTGKRASASKRRSDRLKRHERTNVLMQKSLQAWLEQAEHRHPAIVAAKAQWQAAQANVKATQSDGLPTVDAGYYYLRNGSPDQSVNSYQTEQRILAVTLNIPIFDGFSTTYKVRAAQALAEQKGIEYQATQQQTLQELVQTHAEAQAAWKNLFAADSLFAAAKEASQSTQRQYDKGVADILQLNQSLTGLQQALMEKSKAQSEWSRARLKLWMIDALLK